MPVPLSDLMPGDWVILNCPKARIVTQRPALLNGVFQTIDEAIAVAGDIVTMPVSAADRLAHVSSSTSRWASFRVLTVTDHGQSFQFSIVLAVDEEDCMRDEEGRRVFIAQRVGRPGIG